MKLKFLGAAGTVTGSKYLLTEGGYRLLVDCGLFQGLKNLRLRNWRTYETPSSEIDAIVLTHAHIDHSGYIPKLYKEKYMGEVHCTKPTKELCRILLPDCGYLQEEDARYANKMGFSKHHPALPLYTEEDAQKSIRSFAAHDFFEKFKLGPFELRLIPAGHILGAASLEVKTPKGTLLFSGDIGRYTDYLMHPPQVPDHTDIVIMESTYGNRLHEKIDPINKIKEIIENVIKNKSKLLVPTFAVARAQTLLYCLHKVFQKDKNLKIPVYLDSPMATDVTQLYRQYSEFHKLSPEETTQVCTLPHFTHSSEESKSLNNKKGPLIILSASGMLTGGRVLHHLKQIAPNKENFILLPGYQAAGTRGANILAGASSVKVHGEYIPINASVFHMDTLSAHADQSELLRWLGSISNPPKKVYIVHGEPSAADTLRIKIQDTLHINTQVAEDKEEVNIF